MPGSLTTHVLDNAKGRPAAGVAIELWRLEGGRQLVTRTTTNADGRTDGPLLEGDAFTPGAYELVFAIGPYFGTDSFWTEVPVRFTIRDASQHYHVPLLASPWSYTTYRGS
jgi:5-hydroxyisourate hydrolase